MKLTELIQHLPFLDKRHFSEQEITGISFDSRKVEPGNLFVAIPGTLTDGHQFIPQALEKGAVTLVVEQDTAIPNNIPLFRVENTRKALSRLAAFWYGHPSRKQKIIGITGTNGKTTICCLLEKIFSEHGEPAGRIGTIGYHYLNQEGTLAHTTPESTEIQRLLKEMLDHRVERIAMEVSSHAIDLHRADDIHFDQAVFTNLTPEHLDYHKSMELYFESKKRLFTLLLPMGGGIGRSIINADDPYGQKILEAIQDEPVWTYSTQAQSKWDFFVQDWHSTLQGLEGRISTPMGEMKFTSPLIGRFNLSNILAATAAASGAGVPLDGILRAVKNFSHVPGRLERIPNSKNLHVFVDYAHTPDALKNVLKALRELDPKKIITVFGCGGDRDKAKRPIMGREAALFSDKVFVTSDNPRTEEPDSIIKEILPGIQEGGMVLGRDCQVQPDRKQAIAEALGEAQEGEVVLIAGKGHEDYQILGTQRIHFDDREVAREILGK
ncbi:MAG: UDP-N-acetylmuramoyl-L-alanyl-D-glutamate--2,6-diaminopimelate ligase [bacterium]|nr:UDP-N-acetylmuramoyl-L-alanyl-D-glutamate--2,6-diaminopimelate ligase [bacterium]